MDQTTPAEPLSALDAAFLFFERPEQPLVVGCIAELEGLIEPVLLLERLEDLVRALPRFRQRPVRIPLDIERPAWEDDPDFSLIRHFRSTEWPADGFGDASEAVLSAPLRADRPLWEIVSIAGGPDGRAAVIFRAHHCMLDGMSGMRVLDLLTDAAAPVRARRPRKGTSRRGASEDKQAWGNPFGGTENGAPVWNHMRDIAELTSTVVSLLHEDPAPPTTLNAPLTSRRRATWATFDREEYGPVCSETGTTVNDLALSVISGALRRYLWRHHRTSTRKSLRTIVPVSLRGGGNDPSLGNAISAMFPRLPVDVADPLERLDRISTEMRALHARGQPRATAYGLRMMGALPPVVEAALPMLMPPTPIVNTVCTNVPGPKNARTLAGSRVLALHGVVPLFHGMGVEFAILTHDGCLSICAHLDPNVVPHGDELAGDLEQAFAALRRAEKRTRKHRREIKRLGALLRPVSRFSANRKEAGVKKTSRPATRRDA